MVGITSRTSDLLWSHLSFVSLKEVQRSSCALGLASGLALAVRPAGLAEVSGAQGWVLKMVSAKRA